MRCFVAFLAAVLVAVEAWSAQPRGIRLDPSGVSYIYPVVESADWLLTQPDYGRIYSVPDSFRITHFGDEYYAQDWARECGKTHGQRLFAGISGKVIFAGWRGPWGNTVVIHDVESGFALKYSHLSEVSVASGEWVLAGRSFLGRVGNTGNIQPSGCPKNPGAHLHLVLFKGVRDAASRPISTTVAGSGDGPTAFAAPFEYAAAVDLVRTRADAAVFVNDGAQLAPVSAPAFESHGWNFDKQGQMIQPVRFVPETSGQKTFHWWPLRDGSLLKADSAPAVYVFIDGRKRALSSDTFSCREYRFGEVESVPAGERDRYLPVRDQDSAGCMDESRAALGAWARLARRDSAFREPDWSSYAAYHDWDQSWELRSLTFRHDSGRDVMVYWISSLNSSGESYLGYWNPQTGGWSGWLPTGQ
jgi:murein DD-endopeptidase MepM/ murein hydrolase activator NlpD